MGLKCDQLSCSLALCCQGYRTNYVTSNTTTNRPAKRLSFDQQFLLAELTITELYRYRWQVELFFNGSNNMRIKSFFGTTAVKKTITQRCFSLRAGCDHQEAAPSGCQPLHNFTDFERDHFRENAFKPGTFRERLQKGGGLGELVYPECSTQSVILLNMADIIQAKAAFMLHQHQRFDERRGLIAPATAGAGKW